MTPSRSRMMSFTRSVLQLKAGNVGHRVHRCRQLAEQREAVGAHLEVVGIDHHVVEEAVDRRAQLRQGGQRFGVATRVEIGTQRRLHRRQRGVQVTLGGFGEQAVNALLPIAFAGFHKTMQSMSKVPMTLEITDNRVRFSTPESAVDMEVVRGFNGQAIRVLNLPSPQLQEYTQFKSLSHPHTSATRTWNHSGTNGFLSKFVASGK